MARPRKNMVDASEIILKAVQGLSQMEAPLEDEDSHGYEGWIRVGQAKELFGQIMDMCLMDGEEEA